MSAALTLTIVVTAHSEGRLLRPTLRAITEAVAELVPPDSAEVLLVCDNADEATTAEAAAWARRTDLGFRVRCLSVALGESGASRNFGARNSAGLFVAFVDGDDLVSRNYFAEALRTLRSSDGRTIVHPEYVVSFGDRSLLWRTESTRTHAISHLDLLRHNLWPSSSVSSREVYLEHPYRTLPPEDGYGPEDWIWNIDTSAAGISHDVAPATAFFYRVREEGGVNNRHSTSLLPPVDLDGLRRHMPSVASTSPASPTTAQRVYAALLPFARRATGWLSWEVKHGIYRGARFALRAVTRRSDTSGNARELSATLRPLLLAAAEIDPALSWTAFGLDDLEVWTAHDDGYSSILLATLDHIGERGGAVVAVPWLGIGGADMVALNYAKALNETGAFAGRTTILGTFDASRTVHELIPGALTYSHLDERWLGFAPELRQRFIAQLLVFLRPELIVSVNSFHLTQALRRYAKQITDGTRVFATLFAFDRIGDGYPTNPITDDGQRRYLDLIDGLITDNSTTAGLIDDILALPPTKVRVHRQPTDDGEHELPRGTRAYNNEYFAPDNPFRILWPHRLDEEKQPEVLPRIARALRSQNIPAVIEVWGQRVLTKDGDTLLADLAAAGVVYRGPYSGGLPALDTYGYHALLLTSKSEGLPLVLVQSLQRGLPVIAASVGGVPDIIVDGETGILVEGEAGVQGYVSAIGRLIDSVDLRRHLIETGYELAEARHSWRAFQATVEDSLAHLSEQGQG